MHAISAGRKIQDLEKAQDIVASMIEIGLAEPNWRERAADILAHWYALYLEMPNILEGVWQVKEKEIIAQRQQQKERTKTAVTRRKELNQEIEQLILIAAIERQRTDPRHAAAAQMAEAKLAEEQIQAQLLALETKLQERIEALKGKIV
jgi:hypothetical protein